MIQIFLKRRNNKFICPGKEFLELVGNDNINLYQFPYSFLNEIIERENADM